MLPFLPLLAVPAPIASEVAFTARFYYPPGDRRTSYPQVYVCRLDGSRRRQLTFGRDQVSPPQWLGNGKLVWLVYGKGKNTLVVYDLAKGRVAARKKVSQNYVVPEPEERGVPAVENADKYFAVTFQGDLKPYPSSAFTIPYREAWKWRLFDGSEIGAEKTGDDMEFHYSYLGKDHTIHLDGHPVVLRNDAVRKRAFLITYSGGASAGTEIKLYRFDPAAGKVSLLVDGVDGLDFQPASRYWSACEGWRPMSDYGKGKHVWTTALYVGDLKTGKRWKIVSGLVQGVGVQIRPGI